MSQGSHMGVAFFPYFVPNFALILCCCLQYDFSELLLDKNKNLRKKGDKIKNEKYAKTLEQVQNDPESFYNGTLAKDIAEDIKRVNGNVTVDDLRNYTSISSRKPYKSELSGMNMYLTPPPTSGAVLSLILNILKGGWCSLNLYFLLWLLPSSFGRGHKHQESQAIQVEQWDGVFWNDAEA